MNTPSLFVIAAGLVAIVAINWYFLGTSKSVQAQPASGSQSVTIRVQGGYEPRSVTLKRGVPATLIFDRQEAAPCSEEVVIPALGVRRYLPPHERTAVQVIPDTAGTFDITCGMSMLHGTLVVED